jgi:formamidase
LKAHGVAGKVTDGTPCGFPAPTRMFGAKAAKAAE